MKRKYDLHAERTLRRAICRTPGLTEGTRLIAIALLDCVNSEGLSHPSCKALADATCMDTQTAKRALNRLVSSGLIRDTGKRVGHTHRVRVFAWVMGTAESPLGGAETGTEEYPLDELETGTEESPLAVTQTGTEESPLPGLKRGPDSTHSPALMGTLEGGEMDTVRYPGRGSTEGIEATTTPLLEPDGSSSRAAAASTTADTAAAAAGSKKAPPTFNTESGKFEGLEPWIDSWVKAFPDIDPYDEVWKLEQVISSGEGAPPRKAVSSLLAWFNKAQTIARTRA